MNACSANVRCQLSIIISRLYLFFNIIIYEEVRGVVSSDEMMI